MSKPNRCEYPFKACEAVKERDALRASLAAAEDKNATLMRDLELACRDLAAVKLSRDAAEAKLAATEHQRVELGAKLLEAVGQRDSLIAKLADAEKHADELAEALDDIRCSCTRVTISGVWATLKCARCHALAAHAARRAGKEETK